jgi:uncharacterized protein (TIGR02271 family)
MDTTIRQWQIPEGTDVVGADGDKVGKVVAAQDSYIVVEKGFFFPTDYYIPTSAIANFDGDKVYLTVTKDEALNHDWDQMPVESSADATAIGRYEGDRLAGITPTGVGGEIDMGATDASLRDGATYSAGRSTGGVDRGADSTRTEARDEDAVRIPVHEEELTATTRPVERGKVRINKNVVSEERTLDVPVTEERVTVRRRTVDRDAPSDEAVLAEDTIEIPIRGEEVDVQKRNRVVEEIAIGKEAVQRTERVADTVRREDVRVDDSSASVMDTTS